MLERIKSSALYVVGALIAFFLFVFGLKLKRLNKLEGEERARGLEGDVKGLRDEVEKRRDDVRKKEQDLERKIYEFKKSEDNSNKPPPSAA